MEAKITHFLAKAAIVAALPLAWSTAPSAAFSPTLSAEQVQAALARGKEQASSAVHGFQVADYVLFDRGNTLHIGPDDHLVDAVLVGTPTERLLYQSYLAAFQRKDLGEAQGQKLGGSYANSIGFKVFAHAPSGDDKDRKFLDSFGSGQLKLSNGQMLEVKPTDIFGPSQDFFIVPGGAHVFRWLGSLDYIFDLADLQKAGADIASLSGTLSFTDSTGFAYSYDVDLKTYK